MLSTFSNVGHAAGFLQDEGFSVFSDQRGDGLGSMLNQAVRDFYVCPGSFLDFVLDGELSSDEGYFRFGPGVTCYGRSCSGHREASARVFSYDALNDAVTRDGQLQLPFDPTGIIDNLRMERYPHHRLNGYENFLKKAYYWLRPLTNQFVREQIQRFNSRNWQKMPFPRWPVDTTVENICERLLLLSMQAKGIDEVPFVWFWPEGARGSVVMTHDVETEAGRDFCPELIDIDDAYGIKASFLLVPEERYAVPPKLLDTIRNRGFEVGVQDLNHDGQLFDRREEFLRRATIINRYGREYGARGFRAGSLYREPDWYEALDFSFDMSIPNVAHLDPQRGGCCTVMPYFIGDILELPVTAIQDYMLFHILNDHSTNLWEKQIELILGKNGFVSFIVHPDYLVKPDLRSVYERLLGHLQELAKKENIWFGLPSEVDRWWRARNKMSLEKAGNSWSIVGEDSDRAVLAYAKNVDGRLVYEVAETTGSTHAASASPR